MSFMDYARKKKPCPRRSNSFLIVFRRTGQVKRGKKGRFFCDCLTYFLLNKSNDLQVDGVRGWKRFTPCAQGLFSCLTFSRTAIISVCQKLQTYRCKSAETFTLYEEDKGGTGSGRFRGQLSSNHNKRDYSSVSHLIWVFKQDRLIKGCVWPVT